MYIMDFVFQRVTNREPSVYWYQISGALLLMNPRFVFLHSREIYLGDLFC